VRKLKNLLSYWFLLLTILTALLTSCRKEWNPDYRYFLSKEYKITYTKTEITSLLGIVEKTYPEIIELKQSVSGDIDVYKIVYATTVSDEEITASGLLCIPKTPGEYPVLCFQNGTNTVKANAPSEAIGNPLYQMIEIVASLGYIVVIPDYPGFGESGNIAHPYLITEPTVQSAIDLLFAVKESVPAEFPGLIAGNDYFLIGYSQGGWATLALHKMIEQNFSSDFHLSGSACGAGPYDMKMLFGSMISSQNYLMPAYLAYIANAYSIYDQFTTPISDIFNEPYAGRLGTLFDGVKTTSQINAQLNTSIPDLIKADLISGFESSEKYAPVREGLIRNSITAWKTDVPLMLLHGSEDVTVSPQATERMYEDMLEAGTPAEMCRKEIIQGVDHGKGIVPCMIKGLMFISDISSGGK
jgi:pimeloyl-ACP methyl ester carboxylesterase